MKIFSDIINNKYYLFFILLFYTIVVSFFIQDILLPNFFPEAVSNQGLLINSDSFRYHELAVSLSNKINSLGWQKWELLAYGERHFIVGLTSLFYALIVPEAWVMIPINAFVHILTVFILIKIALFFTDKYHLALLSVTPYMFFPTASFWYSQLLKDGYYNLGVIMFCYGWMYIAHTKGPSSKSLSILVGPFCILLGYLLMGLIRSFSLSVMLLESLLIFVVLVIMLFILINEKKLNWHQYFKKIFLSLFCILMMGQIQDFLIKNDYTDQYNSDGALISQTDYVNIQSIDKTFGDPDWLSAIIDKKMLMLADIRRGYISANKSKNSSSAIDLDVTFKNATETFLYIPRALQISFFSPFPNEWFEKGSNKSRTVMRKVSMFEMSLVYISFLFFPLIFKYWAKRPELWIALFYCSSMMTLYALVVPNIGTIYRFRYSYLMILISILIISGYKYIYKKYFMDNEKYNS